MVFCGRELHLHGYLLVAPAGAYATVEAASCRPTVHQQYERCALQIHAGTLFRRLTVAHGKISSTLSFSIRASTMSLVYMNDVHSPFFGHPNWFF